MVLSKWSDNENKAKSGWSMENYFSLTNIIKIGGMSTIVFHIYIRGLLFLTDKQKHTWMSTFSFLFFYFVSDIKRKFRP